MNFESAKNKIFKTLIEKSKDAYGPYERALVYWDEVAMNKIQTIEDLDKLYKNEENIDPIKLELDKRAEFGLLKMFKESMKK
jgi:hypothetical protein